MASINWQENTPAKHSSSASSSGNPWFAVAIGLMGIIVGFGIGSWRGGSFASGATAQQVAQVPTPTPTPAAAPQPTPAAGPLQPIDSKVDHIRGDITKAQVAVIEYSDFECPFCKRVEPTMAQISKDYGDKVVVVYRHFPLSFHANAQKEAEASECANDLGGNDAFWKYHDAILTRTTSNGTGFPLDNLVPLAKEIGLNETKFKDCLDGGKFAKHVQDEETSGGAAGVNGTPGSFVVNLKTQKSQMISGAVPFESFKTAIDSALQS